MKRLWNKLKLILGLGYQSKKGKGHSYSVANLDKYEYVGNGIPGYGAPPLRKIKKP